MNKKIGMVLEGGAMRGMYTVGVLDVMMENSIQIDGIIGTSAGALFGANYFSEQKGRAIRYSKRFCNDRRYMSLVSFVLTGNVINKNFAFYKVTKELDKFDEKTFEKNNKGYYVTATNVETGEPEYIEIKNVYDQLEALRATSAIPLFSKTVEIEGKKYLDGGISDSIPIIKCQELGYNKILVVLTQPLEYRKEPLSEKKIKTIEKKYSKYPKLIQKMKNRHNEYNNIVEKIIEMENKKEIFVIRPSQKINVRIIERNEDKLQEVYELGRKDCQKMINDLKKYLQ